MPGLLSDSVPDAEAEAEAATAARPARARRSARILEKKGSCESLDGHGQRGSVMLVEPEEVPLAKRKRGAAAAAAAFKPTSGVKRARKELQSAAQLPGQTAIAFPTSNPKQPNVDID